MKRSNTIAKKEAFLYENEISIIYGDSRESTLPIKIIGEMIRNFHGKKVAIGASRDNPPVGSLGAWLKSKRISTAIASYVAPMLINEGLARAVDDHTIEFL